MLQQQFSSLTVDLNLLGELRNVDDGQSLNTCQTGFLISDFIFAIDNMRQTIHTCMRGCVDGQLMSYRLTLTKTLTRTIILRRIHLS